LPQITASDLSDPTKQFSDTAGTVLK